MKAVDKLALVDSINKMIAHFDKELEEYRELEILMLYVEGQRDILTTLKAAIEKGKYDHAAGKTQKVKE